jgi:hypothetical protein
MTDIEKIIQAGNNLVKVRNDCRSKGQRVSPLALDFAINELERLLERLKI